MPPSYRDTQVGTRAAPRWKGSNQAASSFLVLCWPLTWAHSLPTSVTWVSDLAVPEDTGLAFWAPGLRSVTFCLIHPMN